MRGFTKLKKKHLLKISAVYLIGNLEICQDPCSCDQDDQTLSVPVDWGTKYKFQVVVVGTIGDNKNDISKVTDL